MFLLKGREFRNIDANIDMYIDIFKIKTLSDFFLKELQFNSAY